MEININILTEKGIIDFDNFKWIPLSVADIPNFNFFEFSSEHNKLREVLDFDLSRFCEMEIMKNKWTAINNLNNSQNIFQKIESMFEPCFIVQKVVYDDVGYYLFKIYLEASRPGLLFFNF